MQLPQHYVWTVFPAAVVAGAVATYVTRAVALRLGFVNRPNPIVPQHSAPVAYMGGVGVAVGAGATLGLFACIAGPASDAVASFVRNPLVQGALLYLVLGVFDDLYAFRPPVKFALQVAVAGFVTPRVAFPFTGVYAVDVGLSGLWVLTVVNAVNFTDVCDGLVAGLSVVMLLFLAVVGALQPVAALALAGACVGFLVWNRPPATIFLGDAGSHMLGFLLSAGVLVGARGMQADGIWPFWPAMKLALSVPLFELLFLTAVRVRKGIPWWKGSPDHFALRLQAAGLSRGTTDLLAWAAAALGCAFAFALLHGPVLLQWIVVAVAVGWFTFAWRTLLKYPAPQARRPTFPAPLTESASPAAASLAAPPRHGAAKAT